MSKDPKKTDEIRDEDLENVTGGASGGDTNPIGSSGDSDGIGDGGEGDFRPSEPARFRKV